MNLRVVSYNVLSSQLAQASHYPTLNPDHLKAENRLPVILDKLAHEMQANNNNTTIICLQEVSYATAGALHTFFANRQYHMVTGLYGNKFNGYMGVCLAWPTERFATVDVDICRLADVREDGWPVPPNHHDNNDDTTGWMTGALQRVTAWWDTTWARVWSSHQEPPPTWDDPPEHWALSERRFNVLVTATLRDKQTGQTFCIGNYHMPCAYYCPKAMTLHADLAARRVQWWAAQQDPSVPCILAGDFNIKPHEPVYHFLTTGELDESSEFYPTPKYGMAWKPTMKPMRSAYAVHNGREPDFTNYALSERESEPFIETLDFIFLSDEWKVTDVLDLPHRDAAQGPFPNLDCNEPSDHVLIAATLQIN